MNFTGLQEALDQEDLTRINEEVVSLLADGSNAKNIQSLIFFSLPRHPLSISFYAKLIETNESLKQLFYSYFFERHDHLLFLDYAYRFSLLRELIKLNVYSIDDVIKEIQYLMLQDRQYNTRQAMLTAFFIQEIDQANPEFLNQAIRFAQKKAKSFTGFEILDNFFYKWRTLVPGIYSYQSNLFLSMCVNDDIESFISWKDAENFQELETTLFFWHPLVLSQLSFSKWKTLFVVSSLGSVKIFKYLVQTMDVLDTLPQGVIISLQKALFMSGNLEMIHILEENDISLDDRLFSSATFHHQDLFEYMHRDQLWTPRDCSIDSMPVHECVRSNFLSGVKYCYENKPEECLCDSLLVTAAESNALETVQLLFEIDDKIDVNAKRESNKWTALHYAAARNYCPLLVFLLGRPGIDLNPINDSGNTPLQQAQICKAHEAVGILESAMKN